MALGCVAGVLLRILVERAYRAGCPAGRYGSWALTAVGAFVLGGATGAAVSVDRPGAFAVAVGVALSGALFAYCVFGAAAVRLAGGPREGRVAVVTLTHAVGGLAVAVPAVALAAWAVGR